MKASKPLKIHGGKHYLAPWIIEHFPPHIQYVEPFFGGGSVLFAKPPELIVGHSEVVNDIDGDLMNFWSVLQNKEQFPRLARYAAVTPFSRARWLKSLSGIYDVDPVWRALHFLVKYRQSRQGLGTDWATLSRNRTRGGMNEQVSAWLSAIDGLPEFHERLQRVAIENLPALEVIRKQDGENTLFYCDPPYAPSTRTAGKYTYEMAEDDHEELLDTLADIKGYFILSGYWSEMYEAYSDKYGWFEDWKEIDNKASSSKKKKKKREYLWMNFDPS